MQCIVANPTNQGVITAKPMDDVVASKSTDNIDMVCPTQHVVACSARYRTCRLRYFWTFGVSCMGGRWYVEK